MSSMCKFSPNLSTYMNYFNPFRNQWAGCLDLEHFETLGDYNTCPGFIKIELQVS